MEKQSKAYDAFKRFDDALNKRTDNQIDIDKLDVNEENTVKVIDSVVKEVAEEFGLSEEEVQDMYDVLEKNVAVRKKRDTKPKQDKAKKKKGKKAAKKSQRKNRK